MVDYLVSPLKQKPSTLAQQITWQKSKDVFIDRSRCSLLACLDIAEALKFMHKANTLHGDLKPHNILLVSDHQVCGMPPSRSAMKFLQALDRRLHVCWGVISGMTKRKANYIAHHCYRCSWLPTRGWSVNCNSNKLQETMLK